MPSPPKHGPGLRRSLRYRDLLLYGLAYISPFAPFTTLGYVWQDSNGLIVLAYAVGFACMYFTARSYATMTDDIPNAGSVYGFARIALGPTAGFMAGWMILLDYLLVPALCTVSFSISASTLMPGVPRVAWVLALVALTTTINWFGIRTSARANLVAVTAQLVVICGFLVFGCIALYHGFGAGRLDTAPLYSAAQFDARKLLHATSICIMSFLGFDAISTLSEEVVERDRHLVGRATVHVLVLAMAIFVAMTWVAGDLLAGFHLRDPAVTHYELARAAIGPWATAIIAWTNASIVAVSAVLPTQIGVARVTFAMGRDGRLPRFFARLHPRYAVPHLAMLVTSAVSLATAVALVNRLDLLTSIVNFGALSGFLVLHVAVIKRFAIDRRGRRWFSHWVAPLCGIAVVIGVFLGMTKLAVTVGLAWLVTGAALALRSRS
jgi:amino acid transporter